MAARRGLAHHRDGGVLVGLEALERVGDEEQIHEPEFCTGLGMALRRLPREAPATQADTADPAPPVRWCRPLEGEAA